MIARSGNKKKRYPAIAAANKALRKDSLSLLFELVAAAERGATAVNTLLEHRMRAIGCEVEAFAYRPDDVPLVDEFAAADVTASDVQTCVVGSLKSGRAGRSLLLFAHPDPEPYRKNPPWTLPPFVAKEKDGRVHGWGVADDLAGLVVLVQSCAVLREAKFLPDALVTLVSAPSKAHRRGIAAALDRGLEADGAIYLHPAESGVGLNEIKAFAPGQIEFEVEITGKLPETHEPAHTAFAHCAVNPMEKAQIIIDALRNLDRMRGQDISHPLLQEAIGRSTNLMISKCLFNPEGELSRLSPTCLVGCAISLVPGERLESIKSLIEAAILRGGETDPWLADNPPTISWISGVSAAETPIEAPLYQSVAAALRRSGAQPRVNPLHTSSDIRNPIVQKGIPTVGFGPLCGDLTMAGGVDEWVDVDDLIRSIAVTAEVIVDWCGVKSD